MAIVLSAYVSVFADGLFKLARDEVSLLMGVSDEIERLHGRLERLLPVLADADTRSLQDTAIGRWVKQLKDVVYAAEDVVEEYIAEAALLKRRNSSSLVSCCSSSLSRFSHYLIRGHQTGNKIKTLNRKLDDIINDVSILSLRSSLVDVGGGSSTARRTSRKVSSVMEPELVGKSIEDDAGKLVDLLLSEGNGNQDKRKKISVFAISGMAGIGKTTLAQKVFHDDKLRAKFSRIPPIWVCVSQDFTEAGLLRSIIARAGGKPGKAKEREDLEPILYETVKDQRIFMVLDDIWDARVWTEVLYKPLQSVSAGSVVLVTTRNESIVAQMRSKCCHQVQKLSDEEGWSLLRRMVLQDDGDVGDTKHPLREVGISIIKKCDGLPLAIKSMAGVLSNKGQRPQDWEHVLRSLSFSLPELPEDVMGALYFSYADLPSHLKQCFLYFALFPEDAELLQRHVVRLWIAEGFVKVKEGMPSEEVGKQYWKELVQRNLLQPHSDWYDSTCCKMHDLLHSLARHITSGECLCIDFKGEATPALSQSRRLRRAYIRGGEAIPKAAEKHMSLRTLFFPSIRSITEDAMLKYLRILSISNSPIEKLPDSIGDLKLLRYLNISESAVREIPESIGCLRNLQYLIMYGCKNLHSLPKSIKNLRSLRCLDIFGIEIQTMPEGIGKLQNLAVLYGFLISHRDTDVDKERGNPKPKQRDCNISDLGSLSQLHSLILYNLENVSARMAARAADLRAKNNLVYLELHCGISSSSLQPQADNRQEKIEEIFDELCPPLCVELLIVKGYFGLQYPCWMTNMSSSFLPNLRRLELKDCNLCEHLPPLGLLPQLDCLWIEGAPAVKSIGPELFGLSCNLGDNATQACSLFPKLEILHLENMSNWEEWSWLSEEQDKTTVVLPSLHTLSITACPKLRSLPMPLLCHATALSCLWIEGAKKLTEVENLLYVEKMTLKDNPCLEKVLNLPALKKLWVENSKEVKDVEGLNALQFLEIKDPKMRFLPEWLCPAQVQGSQFGGLRRLVIEGNGQLMSRCLVGAPDWRKMQTVPFVDVYCSDEPANKIHYTKSPFSFEHQLGK